MATRVLLLSATTSYRTEDFVAAARRLGVDPIVATDRCHKLAAEWPEESFGTVSLPFQDPQAAAEAIAALAHERPLAAIMPTDETTAVIAALAAERLGLPGNAPQAAVRARDKEQMRRALLEGGVPCPRPRVFPRTEPPEEVAAQVTYPCVLKPLLLSGSRGVMRADDRAGFVRAWRRLVALLSTLKGLRPPGPAAGAQSEPDPAGARILVEPFVAGPEIAVEAVLRGGALRSLAIFDKPDPLDGPFFEETLYVTPSRHPPSAQAAALEVTGRAARALGLAEGPVHAELRLAADGPVVIEVAARAIGGLCARTLRFGLHGASLEEILLACALGREPTGLDEPSSAAGVMMIPIPKGGVLQAVEGVEEARRIPHVEDVAITARTGEVLVPLPEGASYLGFLFARAETPASVEAALRQAHRVLRFAIVPTLATER